MRCNLSLSGTPNCWTTTCHSSMCRKRTCYLVVFILKMCRNSNQAPLRLLLIVITVSNRENEKSMYRDRTSCMCCYSKPFVNIIVSHNRELIWNESKSLWDWGAGRETIGEVYSQGCVSRPVWSTDLTLDLTQCKLEMYPEWPWVINVVQI